MDKVGPTDGFRLQVEDFVLDLVGHRGSLEGIYYENRSRRKIDVATLPGYKDLVTASCLGSDDQHFKRGS